MKSRIMQHLSMLIFLAAHLLPTEVESAPDEMWDVSQSVTDTLQDMQNSLRILLSESNRQQQDLDVIKDDLGALKYGFSLLQNEDAENHLNVKIALKKILFTVKDVEDKIDDLGTSIASDVGNLQNSIGSLGSDVADLKTCVADLDGDVVEVRQAVANVTTEVENVQSAITVVQTTASTIQANISGLDMDVADLKTCVTDLDGDVVEVRQAVANVTMDVENVQTAITVVQTTASTIQTNITSLDMDVADLKSCVTDLDMDVNTTATCLATFKTDTTTQLSSIQTSVEAIEHPCGGTEDWVQVVNFEVTDTTTTCPGEWMLSIFDIPTCGRPTSATPSDTTPMCYSATFMFPNSAFLNFSKVCGRVRGYAYGGVDGFESFATQTTINDAYVSGVVLTADSPPEHLWTFAAGLGELGRTSQSGEIPDQCPCDRTNPSDIPVPSFVGNNYFCESGLNIFAGSFVFQCDDPLWDGQNCNPESNCCEFNRPPYFVNDLGKTLMVNEIDARICLAGPTALNVGDNGDDVLVEQIELYVAP